jgi:hypothetical protein
VRRSGPYVFGKALVAFGRPARQSQTLQTAGLTPEREDAVNEAGWRHMSSAPKDGSRILVTVRPSEQGPAEVDVAYWARADQFGIEGWRAADSHPGQIIGYADPELKCWMPLPSANLDAEAELPEPWAGEDEELYGSGI